MVFREIHEVSLLKDRVKLPGQVLGILGSHPKRDDRSHIANVDQVDDGNPFFLEESPQTLEGLSLNVETVGILQHYTDEPLRSITPSS